MLPSPTPRQRSPEAAATSAANAATAAGAAGDVTIRRVSTLPEYEECVVIQRETWGAQFTESVPATILRIAQEVGGVTAAAFDATGAMLGFVFGITGVRDGQLSHWSDLLAIRVSARDMGIGKRLKAFQRELLLPIGVRTMYWTFDPLVARNAHLNLAQLGARVVEYRPSFYGDDTGSVMHAALGTDRLIVAWQLDQAVTPTIPDASWADAQVVNAGMSVAHIGAPRARIVIPDDIFVVLDEDLALARRWRENTREAFTVYMGRGYSIVGFLRGSGHTFGTYLLQR